MSGPDRVRVLFLISVLGDAGGAERFALGLATHLPQDRFEPWFCFTRGVNAGPTRALRAANIPYRSLNRRGRWDAFRILGLARLLRERRFDVLHAHMFGSNLWGTVIGRATRVPVVIAHEHTWSYQGDPVRAWLDGRVIGRLATRFVAVSPADAERMVSYEHVPPDKVVVLPTAYIPAVEQSAGDIRAELGLPRDAPVIATAAVMRPQKALDVLLEAHARVLTSVPGSHLVIAGDGDCRQFLERRASELGLRGFVHFLGKRRDIDAIVAAADVGALSSDFEGMPLFMFECMANRTPLVATNVGGIPSVIKNGSTGILVPPRDPDALAAALIALITNPAMRETMAAAALHDLEPFRMNSVVLRFAELYERLVKEARS
jgi:glycosyltransferase involved in cell wall biosynthesis